MNAPALHPSPLRAFASSREPILPTPPPAAMLLSVGGSPAPLLHILRMHRPRHVWYFCSPESRKIADEIHPQLDWHPDRDIVEVERFEELGPCYRALRREIPVLLKKWSVAPDEVLVDYTGGTKTMSAALALAAVERFGRFSYVGGEQREKGGLGVTLDGQERVLYQANPWAELAVREIERACDLWAGCGFEAAARVLRDAASRHPAPARLAAFADLADAMAARHRLDFTNAVNGFGQTSKTIPLLLDPRPAPALIGWIARSREICAVCRSKEANETLLREILDNALRTAAQGRYEDAAARLYRAMEMRGQLWLSEATGGLFKNGKCKAPDLARIPEPIRALPFCRANEDGAIKLSLEQVILALAALGHERAMGIAADLVARDPSGKTKSRWRAATDKRNMGILAHGVLAVGEEGFAQMKELAAEFLGFDLARETDPVPALDPGWME